MEEVSLKTLLYTEEGVEWAVEIWDEFARNRKGERETQRVGEDKQEKMWGMGELN